MLPPHRRRGPAARSRDAARDAAAMGPPGQVATLIVPADFSWNPAGAVGLPARLAARAKPTGTEVAEAVRGLREFGPAAGVLMGGNTLTDAGLKAAERIARGSNARIFADRNAPRSALGRGRFQPQRVAYFPEKAEGQLADLKHILLIEAKAPVSFFAYPGRKSTLLPDDCRITALARPGDDGLATLAALADHFNEPIPARSSSRPLPASAGSEALTLEAMAQVLAAQLPDEAIVCSQGS